MRLVLALLMGCTTTTSSLPPTCELSALELSVETAWPGVRVTAHTTPMTTAWDTVVTVGSQRAEVDTVERDGCEACDACTEANACSTCGITCAACVDACAACDESVVFVVPDLDGGRHDVVVRNGVGSSPRAALTVTGMSDTAAP